MDMPPHNDNSRNDLSKEVVPPNGLLSRAESRLFERIGRFEREHGSDAALTASDASLLLERCAPAGLLERVEEKLFDRISQTSGIEPWELYLKRDKAAANLDKMDDHVFAAVQPRKATGVSFPFLFASTALALAKHRTATFTALAALLLAAGTAGWHYWSGHYAPVTTVVYVSERGTAGGTSTVREAQTVSTIPGQRALLSNSRGAIMMENGASITVTKARQNRMEYVVDFTEQPAPLARAVFSVTKKRDGQKFAVATKDYAINVVGTVFWVGPAASGHITTDVLEGTVAIEGNGIAGTRVSAPGRFAFVQKEAGYASADLDTAQESGEHPPSLPAMQEPPQAALAPRPAEIAASPRQGPRDSLLQAAVRLETSDWKRAVDCYIAALARPGASRYEREIALFSIARLRADHVASPELVRSSFDTYLKEFPHGSFAGESYLRLADLEYGTDPKRALVWYETYLDEFPSTQNTATAEYKAGLIYLQQKNRDRAVTMLSSALRHAKNYPPDQVAAIRRVLDNAKNPRGDSGGNPSGK
jgi:hypothetical protein